MRRCLGCMKMTDQPVCPHCGYPANAANEPHQLPAGSVLREQYLVGRVLGQGGFGITYMGYDQLLDVPVAIKEYYPNGFVTREGNGRAKTNAYIAGDRVDVGMDIYSRGLCLPSDNKMTAEEQSKIIEIVKRCFE